jgi:hypothetical protein
VSLCVFRAPLQQWQIKEMSPSEELNRKSLNNARDGGINLLQKMTALAIKSKGAGRQPPPASNWGAIVLDIRWLLYYLT